MPDNSESHFKPSWDPENTFAGTASYYARYRPVYPDAVISLLKKLFRLTGKSRVLDLGCGTGQVALSLAPYVAEIIAIDPQDEMLREGMSAAAARDITNIKWLKGESGKLLDLASQIGNIELTVIARAFHWMDRDQTLKDLYKLTVAGGGVAVIADNGPTDGFGNDVPPTLRWKQVIRQTIEKWLGKERKAGTEGTFSHPTKPFEVSLKESEFGDFTIERIQIERKWTIDGIIGYLYSTSLASLPVLGDKKELFEADMRCRLQETNPDGKFIEPVTIQIMMLWKNNPENKLLFSLS